MKPKEALIKDGTIPTKMGKGRLSGAQIERCKELAAEGWNIEGYEVTKASSSTPAEVTKKPVETEPSYDVVYHYPEDEYRVYEYQNGKKHYRSLRSACGHCSHSLVVCYCPEPKIVSEDGRGWVRVYIEAA